MLQVSRFLSVMTVGCLLAACGTNAPKVVTGAAVTTYIQNDEQWVQADVSLNTAGFQLGMANIPIFDPTHPAIQYAVLNITPTSPTNCTSNCTGVVTVDLNISQISHLPNGPALLPNGVALPVSGLGSATVISLPIVDSSATNSVLYFASGPQVAMLGAALSFSALDPAGQYAPGAAVFQPIIIGSGMTEVDLMAGIYAGAAPKTTGVGFFIDLSHLLPNGQPAVAEESDGIVSIGGKNSKKSALVMKPFTSGDTNQINAMYQEIYQLHKKNTRLDIND